MKQDFPLRQTILFLVLCGGLLWGSWMYTAEGEKANFAASALMNVGFILGAVTLLNVAWWLAGGDPVGATLNRLDQGVAESSKKLSENQRSGAETLQMLSAAVNLVSDARETGLVRVLSISKGFDGQVGDWMERLKGARESIDLMGFNLLVWTKGHDFANEVVRLARQGVRIRVLIMDDRNPDLGGIINRYQIPSLTDPSFIGNEIIAAKNSYTAIAAKVATNPEARGKFEFRTVKRGLIVCQTCRIDEEVVAIPYLFSVVASESPLIVARGGQSGLFRAYNKEFEKLWDLNDPSGVSRDP